MRTICSNENGKNLGNYGNRALLRLNQHGLGVENRTGGAHPGTEERSMCGGLMLRMMPGMFGGLSVSQATDREDTEHQ